MLPTPDVATALLTLDRAATQSKIEAENGPVQVRGACEDTEYNHSINVCLRGGGSLPRPARPALAIPREENGPNHPLRTIA